MLNNLTHIYTLRLNKAGVPPLHIASLNGASKEIVALLLSFGADATAQVHGSTALELAEDNNHEHLVSILSYAPLYYVLQWINRVLSWFSSTFLGRDRHRTT